MARLIVVSNRVAIPSLDGASQAGGLAVAVRSLLKRRPGMWFGWSGGVSTEEDALTKTIVRGGMTYVVTDLTDADYQEYYNGFANRVLWPILHYRLDLAEFSRRDLSGYRRVNAHFASQLHNVLEPDDVLWVHDYHLIPLAKMLRDRGHRNRIGFFLHVPFPPPEIITALPNHEWLIPQLSAYDLVGLQTKNDATNLARYFEHECRLQKLAELTYQSNDHAVRVGVFPIGIETSEFSRLARRSVRSPLVRNVLESLAGRAMMIGVDRLDYSKGLAQRMDAFERFLAVYPDWRGKVTYLQITPKSRSEIQEYSEMEQLDQRGRRPHQRRLRRGRVDADPLRQPRLQPQRAGGPLPRRARGAGHAVARRHEPRGQGIRRGAGPGGSGRADPVALRGRGGRVRGGAAGQSVRSRSGGNVDRARALDAARGAAPRHEALFQVISENDIKSWGELPATLTQKAICRAGASSSGCSRRWTPACSSSRSDRRRGFLTFRL